MLTVSSSLILLFPCLILTEKDFLVDFVLRFLSFL